MPSTSPLRTAPLSYMQEQLWISQRLRPDSSAYNLVISIHINHTLNLNALQASLNMATERHEALRTTFDYADGQPVQIVSPPEFPIIKLINLQHVHPDNQNANAKQLITDEAKKIIPLGGPSLLKLILIQFSEENFQFHLIIHHIIIDGYSIFRTLLPEIRARYDSLLTGANPPQTNGAVHQMADYAIHNRIPIHPDQLATHIAFWKWHLESPQVTPITMYDLPKPPRLSGRGDVLTISLPQEVIANLRRLASRAGSSLFTVFLSALGMLIHRWTGSDDFLIETAVATRDTDATKGIIGPLLNTIPIRLQIRPTDTIDRMLSRISAILAEIRKHALIPFEIIANHLKAQHKLSQNQTLQIAINKPPIQDCGDWHATPYDIHTGTSKFDIAFEFEERTTKFLLHMEYSTDVFLPQTIARIAEHYRLILEALSVPEPVRISDIDLLSAGEKIAVLQQSTNKAGLAHTSPFFHKIFEQHAESKPEAIAIVSHGETVTYGALNKLANQLAYHLRNKGILPESAISVFLNKSPYSIISMLAILKACAAYLPIDPYHPDARISYAINDSKPSLIITDSANCARLRNYNIDLFLIDNELPTMAPANEDLPHVPLRPENIAYIIYTSGTSGTPKGTAVEHRNLSHLAAATTQRFHFQPGDRILQFASPSFDASIWEYLFALSAGATLVLWDQNAPQPSQSLTSFIHDQRVTAALLSPTVLAALPEEDDHLLVKMHTVISGGEPCTSGIIRRWAPGRRFFNAYGPTEITVCATMKQCTDDESQVTIGTPLPGVECYVLGSAGELMPRGLPGELYIGGAGVARCYLNRPDLTADRYIPNPYHTDGGQRIYKTGDLVRWKDGGELEYLGRIDQQVKLRGVRIELGEIESVLERHPAIRTAAAILIESSPIGPYIHSFIVPKSLTVLSDSKHSEEMIRQIKTWLRTQLPEVMNPSAFDILRELPITSSGKADRKALRTSAKLPRNQAQPSDPLTENEATLAAIWAKLLGYDKLNMNDNFFDLGGNSMMVIQAQMAIQKRLGRDVPILDFFRFPTIRALSDHLSADAAPVAVDQSKAERAQKQRAAHSSLAKRWSSKRSK